MPSASLASTVGAGIITASSAARNGAMAKAAMASAPMAAAQSLGRLNWLRGMVSSWGADGRQFRARTAFRNQQAALSDAQDTRRHGSCYKAVRHEFVNKFGRNPRC